MYLFIFTKKQNKTKTPKNTQRNKPNNKKWGGEWCKRGIEDIIM